MEGGRDGGRGGGMEGGREGWREGVREGGIERGTEGRREGGRERFGASVTHVRCDNSPSVCQHLKETSNLLLTSSQPEQSDK